MTFTADAHRAVTSRAPEPGWITKRRSDAFERFGAAGLPTEADDLWKYSGIEDLDLASYAPWRAAWSGSFVETLQERARSIASAFGERSALLFTFGGQLVGAEGNDPDRGTSIFSDVELGEEPGRILTRRDAFDDLHDAFVLDGIHFEVKSKHVVDQPIVVVHFVGVTDQWTESTLAPAFFPHLRIHAGASSELKVIEVITGFADEPGRGLVLPATELDVEDNAHVTYAYLQLLPPGWKHLGVQAARVGRDATLQCFSASLGASTGRVRADAELLGESSEAVMVAGFLGSDDQVHDLRTIQDHVAPRTRSQLLCMGAVLDESRSAYVGLTRVRNGAHGADAFQTNRNLVLSEGAHADSVPNLDIQENDVRCSHASTVGPIDEDQRYYLESRGIDPEVAERLIVLGFFRDLSLRVPVKSVGRWFVDAVSRRFSAHDPDAVESTKAVESTTAVENTESGES
ncbi:MAG: SufD family Fe-S cluster assembly protein [Acidimicrobiales bacterium]